MMRRLLGRLRDWWNGEPGRHALGFDTDGGLTTRAVRMAASPESAWVTEARQRALYPHRYWSLDRYAGWYWLEFYGWLAKETALANAHRADCGLPPRPVPPLPPAHVTETLVAA